jgi:hypothetical protein
MLDSQVMAPQGRMGRGVFATAAANNWSAMVKCGIFELGTLGPVPNICHTVSIGSGQNTLGKAIACVYNSIGR